jgi:hypothetical protein
MDNDGFWRCSSGGTWRVVSSGSAEEAAAQAELDASIKLWGPELVRFTMATTCHGVLWGDYIYEMDAQHEAALTTEERRARDAAVAERERQAQLDMASRQRELFADIARQKAAAAAAAATRGSAPVSNVARTTSSAPAANKVPLPCKFLYVARDGSEPDSSTICSECWRHEYVDPKTKQRKIVHACDRLHPGEPGWKPEWSSLPLNRGETVISYLRRSFPPPPRPSSSGSTGNTRDFSGLGGRPPRHNGSSGGYGGSRASGAGGSQRRY